jgi:hypothetical protein
MLSELGGGVVKEGWLEREGGMLGRKGKFEKRWCACQTSHSYLAHSLCGWVLGTRGEQSIYRSHTECLI